MTDTERQLLTAIENLTKRIADLDETQPLPLPNGEARPLRLLSGCVECGIVFIDSDAYGEHLCIGKQGR